MDYASAARLPSADLLLGHFRVWHETDSAARA